MITMVDYIKNLEPEDSIKIQDEIAYMLHCSSRDTPWIIQMKLRETAKDIDP